MAFEISKHFTVAPFVALFRLKVVPVLVWPVLVVHLYMGLVPVLVALTLNATEEPAHIGLAVVCVILIVGVTVALKLTDVLAVAVQLLRVAVTV